MFTAKQLEKAYWYARLRVMVWFGEDWERREAYGDHVINAMLGKARYN